MRSDEDDSERTESDFHYSDDKEDLGCSRPTSRSERLVEEALVMKGLLDSTTLWLPHSNSKGSQGGKEVFIVEDIVSKHFCFFKI